MVAMLTLLPTNIGSSLVAGESLNGEKGGHAEIHCMHSLGCPIHEFNVQDRALEVCLPNPPYVEQNPSPLLKLVAEVEPSHCRTLSLPLTTTDPTP